MRNDDKVSMLTAVVDKGMPDPLVIAQPLAVDDVQSGTTQVARFQSSQQGRFVDDAPAAGVENNRALFHAGYCRGIKNLKVDGRIPANGYCVHILYVKRSKIEGGLNSRQRKTQGPVLSNQVTRGQLDLTGPLGG